MLEADVFPNSEDVFDLLPKKTGDWLRKQLIEENVRQGSSQFSLAFHFISKKQSTIITRNDVDLMEHLVSLLSKVNTKKIEDEDEDESESEEEIDIKLKDNPGVFFFNYGKEFNMAVYNTIKTVRETWKKNVRTISDLELDELLFSIDNNLFNFVNLMTLNDNESKILESAPINWQDPGWILDHVDMGNTISYRRLVRRIFIFNNPCFSIII